MNIKTKSIVSGKLVKLEVFRNGKSIHKVENVPNIILNSGISGNGHLGNVSSGNCYLMESTVESYEDLPGTWNQTGNTITRATGAGTFPASPSQLGNELKWNTGERCHVTARASDTSITVSGPARTITGGTIRRYNVNEASGSVGDSTGYKQTSSTHSDRSTTYNKATGVAVDTTTVSFASATVAYNLGSIIHPGARIVLPAPIAIEIDDQVKYTYARTETHSNRTQVYELGAESPTLPQKYAITSIVGNGTQVDVTFSTATHFLAGDKLDLRSVTTKKHAISSASSTSTTFTINTATAHGLAVSDSVTIENASLAGYNGVHTVSAVVDSDTFEITNAANPGAMGASGTARLTTPATYFDDLGLATIASMVSSSVARITSAITGPAVNLDPIGGDPGVSVVFFHPSSSTVSAKLLPWPSWSSGGTNNASSGPAYIYNATNALSIKSEDNNVSVPDGGTSSKNFSSRTGQSAAYSNDWTASVTYTLNANNAIPRMKQTMNGDDIQAGCLVCQVTFNTPIDFQNVHRLTQKLQIQVLRDLP